MKHLLIILSITISVNSFSQTKLTRVKHMKKSTRKAYLQYKLDRLKETTFRFPCGDSVGTGYYIAQGFQDNINGCGDHLGLDINGLGGGDTDLGDTIYSIGYGIVAQADSSDYLAIYYKHHGKIIKTVYYHCKEIFYKAGDLIPKGYPIATIGNSDGIYLAHLHLEIITDTIISCGFYGEPKGFIDPIEILPFHEKKKKLIQKERRDLYTINKNIK